MPSSTVSVSNLHVLVIRASYEATRVAYTVQRGSPVAINMNKKVGSARLSTAHTTALPSPAHIETKAQQRAKGKGHHKHAMQYKSP
jgi:hypothetical protein